MKKMFPPKTCAIKIHSLLTSEFHVIHMILFFCVEFNGYAANFSILLPVVYLIVLVFLHGIDEYTVS